MIIFQTSLGRRGDVDRGCDEAHRAASGSACSHSASACSTADPNECRRTPSSSAAWSSAGQQILLQSLHQRQHQLWVLARDRRCHTRGDACQIHSQRDGRAVDEHQLGDRLEHLAVAEHVRPADVEYGAAARAVGARGEHRDHVAPVDRLGAERVPRRQCEHRHALDEVHEQTKRARARADHDRCAQRQRIGHRVEQHALHVCATRQMTRTRGSRWMRSYSGSLLPARWEHAV